MITEEERKDIQTTFGDMIDVNEADWLGYRKMVGPSKDGQRFCKIYMSGCNTIWYHNELHAYEIDALAHVRVPGAVFCCEESVASKAQFLCFSIPSWNAVTKHDSRECIRVLQALHDVGYKHGDVTKNGLPKYDNFVKKADDVRLIDFELCSPATEDDLRCEMAAFLQAVSYVSLRKRNPRFDL